MGSDIREEASMTKPQAIYNFFNSFGVDAYPLTAVPDDQAFPFIAYEGNIGNTGDQISIAVQLWMHTDSEASLNNKVEQISTSIGMGGKVIHYDGGSMWIKRGNPWSIPITHQTDNTTKGRSLNIEIEFM